MLLLTSLFLSFHIDFINFIKKIKGTKLRNFIFFNCYKTSKINTSLLLVLNFRGTHIKVVFNILTSDCIKNDKVV